MSSPTAHQHDFKEYNIAIPVIETSYVLQGRLCIPNTKEVECDDLDLVLILHGFLGHKDYCYQKQLAHDLPQRLGLATIRFDFMSCGDSFPPHSINRTLQNDIRDLDSMLEWIRGYNKSVDILRSEGSLNNLNGGFVPPTKQKLFLKGGVGHSRGSHALLSWSAAHALASSTYTEAVLKIPDNVKNLKYHVTPGVKPMEARTKLDGTVSPPLEFLVNCSGRYRTSYLMESYENRIPDFKQRGGEKLSVRRPTSKKIEDLWVPYEEITDLSDIPINKILDCLITTWCSQPPIINTHDSESKVNGFPNDTKYKLTKILLVYGDADHIVPILDGYMYNSHFQRAMLTSQGKTERAVKETWSILGELTNNPHNTKTADGKREKSSDWEYYWSHLSNPLTTENKNKLGALVINDRNYAFMENLYSVPLDASLCEFILIPNADHNFYGKPREHIVPKEKKANYNPQVITSILNWLGHTIKDDKQEPNKKEFGTTML